MDARAQMWKHGLAEDLLDMWPAQELICVDDAWWTRHGDEWRSRWISAGGRFCEDRMIALKNDPVWRKLSSRKKPYPPFHREDVLDTLDVSRADAEKYCIIARDEVLERSAFKNDAPQLLVRKIG